MNRNVKYLIIGGGAAAVACAEELRQRDKTGTIRIVTDESAFAYSRPLISYYLKGAVTREQMSLRKEGYFESLNIEVIKNLPAVAVDAEKKTVSFSDGSSVLYEKLLLATGSVPFVPPVQGLGAQKNVTTFLKLKDSELLKSNVNCKTRAVVLGGGLIGMKAAEGLSHICGSVTVIEMADRLLPTILDKAASELVEGRVAQNGVRVILGQTIARINGDQAVTSVKLTGGEELPCDMLVFGVGVRPDTRLAEGTGIHVERGIVTDSHMQTSVTDIYAAGDCVSTLDLTDGRRRVLALWFNAVHQGKLAGAAMTGAETDYRGAFAMNAIDFYGLRMITAGAINPLPEDEFESQSLSDGTSYKKLVTKNDRLKGFILMGNVERAGILTDLVNRGLPLSELAETTEKDISVMMYGDTERKKKLTGGVCVC